jgi:YfiH family protein
MTTALQADRLGVPNVRHGFYTRKGGVSSGIYASLNCGFGSRDAREDVGRNRALVAADLGVGEDQLLTIYQFHSADVEVVEQAWPAMQPPKGDAMVTDRPGIGLGILSADCAPVLFADAGAGVIGAAHAGWRGALGGIVEATVAAMETLGATRETIAAAVGPCIAQPSYEVGPEFLDLFLADSEQSRRYFLPSQNPDHHMFDLRAFVSDRLVDSGIAIVDRVGSDTYSEEDLFFSYRRGSHRGEDDYGRQISVISLAV